jgi:hypothetical protein
MELGLRLCAAGWTLRRIATRGVLHHGRDEGNWPLLLRRWKCRYLDGAGELIRASVGRPYFHRAVQTQQHLVIALLLWVGLVAGVLLLPLTPWLLAGTVAAVLALVLARARRAGSLADAAFGQVVWQVTALAMLRGLLARPRNPTEPIESVVLCDAPARPPSPDKRGRQAEAGLYRLPPGEGRLPLAEFLACVPHDVPISLEVPNAALRALLSPADLAARLLDAAVEVLAGASV